MNFLQLLAGHLETSFAVHGVVFFLNLMVLLFSESLLKLFNKGKDISIQAKALRFAAVLFLILHILDVLLVETFPAYENYFIRIGLTIATFFGCLISFNVVSYYSRQKFGIQRQIEGQAVFLDSYNSRLMDLVSAVFVILAALYFLIVIWELDGLLQTTGFLGIIFAFLALTNSIWAPDIYFGLVILNSNMLEDGDVIKLRGSSDEFIISRVSFIYTILLDVRNNHRILMRNSHLVNDRVDNLSKRASTDGIRHVLNFKVGYPPLEGEREKADDDSKTKIDSNSFKAMMSKITKMFESAYAGLADNAEVKINKNLPFEITLIDSGDYALTFSLHYYIEALPNTKTTRVIRQYLTKTPALIQEAVNNAAIEQGIQLATPILIQQSKSTSDAG